MAHALMLANIHLLSWLYKVCKVCLGAVPQGGGLSKSAWVKQNPCGWVKYIVVGSAWGGLS